MVKEINDVPQAPLASSPSEISASNSMNKQKRQGSTNIFVIVLVVVITAVAWMWISKNKLSGFDKDWQAIFLTNGQVYFGQIKSQNSVEIIAKDIYYLQVTRPLQQTEEGQQQATDQQGELSLVKLGNELHGPTDSMFINRDHVLF
ncbi:hypothetical protein KKF64_00565, partial [Patescibacteria group bacterium]|nr:hypothetical protein [Patescibacteria group bacterium]